MDQKQILLTKVETTSQKLDPYLSIIHSFTDPVNIFINMEDINNNRQYIYYFAYSFGKKKIVFWGIYDNKSTQFYIDGKCKYNPNQLNNIVSTRKKENYKYIGNIVYNRINNKLSEYGVGETTILDDDVYNLYKYLIGYYDKLIDKKQFENIYGKGYIDKYEEKISMKNDIYPDSKEFIHELNKNILSLKEKVLKHEKMVNLIDKVGNILPKVSEIINYFYETIKTGSFLYDYGELRECPKIKECDNYDDGCQVYFYGVADTYLENYYHEGDIRLLK